MFWKISPSQRCNTSHAPLGCVPSGRRRTSWGASRIGGATGTNRPKEEQFRNKHLRIFWEKEKNNVVFYLKTVNPKTTVKTATEPLFEKNKNAKHQRMDLFQGPNLEHSPHLSWRKDFSGVAHGHKHPLFQKTPKGKKNKKQTQLNVDNTWHHSINHIQTFCWRHWVHDCTCQPYHCRKPLTPSMPSEYNPAVSTSPSPGDSESYAMHSLLSKMRRTFNSNKA